ncbi:DUF1634 domain-containing protein [Sphingobacterium sp. LRF_L2]|uniref:DUF1634 domain-containing protein n=1 Tax=Sphingobacterium sp. LRF_L2 TaxID=3369421 RepID=UPI003F626DD5
MQITDKTIQNVVANVLKYGVRTVLFFGITGGLIFLVNHSTEQVDYSKFIEKDNSIFEVISHVIRGAIALDGRAVIYLGILILFFTPFLRLLLSLGSFILERDKLYVFITLLVLAIIALSVSLGLSH